MYILSYICYILSYVYICKFMYYVNIWKHFMYVFIVLSLIQRGRTHDKCILFVYKIDADLIYTGRLRNISIF